jgi:hypothetical protein
LHELIIDDRPEDFEAFLPNPDARNAIAGHHTGTAQFAENRFAENEISVNRVDMPKSFFQMEIRFAEKQSVDSFTQIYNRE